VQRGCVGEDEEIGTGRDASEALRDAMAHRLPLIPPSRPSSARLLPPTPLRLLGWEGNRRIRRVALAEGEYDARGWPQMPHSSGTSHLLATAICQAADTIVPMKTPISGEIHRPPPLPPQDISSPPHRQHPPSTKSSSRTRIVPRDGVPASRPRRPAGGRARAACSSPERCCWFSVPCPRGSRCSPLWLRMLIGTSQAGPAAQGVAMHAQLDPVGARRLGIQR
jgi:hypothetical protein